MTVSHKQRPCGTCETMFPPTRRDQIFCSPACKQKAKSEARMRSGNLTLYRLLYHWRLSKQFGNLSPITREVDSWIGQDKKEGKAPPPFPDEDNLLRR